MWLNQKSEKKNPAGFPVSFFFLLCFFRVFVCVFSCHGPVEIPRNHLLICQYHGPFSNPDKWPVRSYDRIGTPCKSCNGNSKELLLVVVLPSSLRRPLATSFSLCGNNRLRPQAHDNQCSQILCDIAADGPQEDLAKFGCKPKVKFEKYHYIILASLLEPLYKNLAICFWVIVKVVKIDRKI